MFVFNVILWIQQYPYLSPEVYRLIIFVSTQNVFNSTGPKGDKGEKGSLGAVNGSLGIPGDKGEPGNRGDVSTNFDSVNGE